MGLYFVAYITRGLNGSTTEPNKNKKQLNLKKNKITIKTLIIKYKNYIAKEIMLLG